MDRRPIGIFDSGVGGLTVAREVRKQLPHEDIVYFGDLARLPYGSKSKENIISFSRQIIRFLLTKDVKAIVIACGTASSNSLHIVSQEFDLPIIGIVEPGSKAAVETTRNGKIGIIGTEATIDSGAFSYFINIESDQLEVYTKACPLFAPLVEEGWFEDEVTKEISKRYLKGLKDHKIDTLILGCTHYPLLKPVIRQLMGDEVKLINPGEETAKQLKKLLDKANLVNADDHKGTEEFFVSDSTKKFEDLAGRILNKPMLPVKKINIEKY